MKFNDMVKSRRYGVRKEVYSNRESFDFGIYNHLRPIYYDGKVYSIYGTGADAWNRAEGDVFYRVDCIDSIWGNGSMEDASEQLCIDDFHGLEYATGLTRWAKDHYVFCGPYGDRAYQYYSGKISMPCDMDWDDDYDYPDEFILFEDYDVWERGLVKEIFYRLFEDMDAWRDVSDDSKIIFSRKITDVLTSEEMELFGQCFGNDEIIIVFNNELFSKAKKQRLKKHTHYFGDGITFTPGYDDEPQYWQDSMWSKVCDIVHGHIGYKGLKIGNNIYDIETRGYGFKVYLDGKLIGVIKEYVNSDEFVEAILTMTNRGLGELANEMCDAVMEVAKEVHCDYKAEIGVMGEYIDVYRTYHSWREAKETVCDSAIRLCDVLSEHFDDCMPYCMYYIERWYDGDGHCDDEEFGYRYGVTVSLMGHTISPPVQYPYEGELDVYSRRVIRY